MIEYFRTDGVRRTLTKLDAEENGCWIVLLDPEPDELAEIEERFEIDHEDSQAALDLEEVSRVEKQDEYTMFIVDTPVREKSLGANGYKTIPIAVFQTPTNVITICSGVKLPLIACLRSMRDLSDTTDVRGFTCDILMASSAAYFAALRRLNKRRIELSTVRNNPTRRELEELYSLDASLVYLKTSLATNDTIFERFQRRMLLVYNEDEREDFDDVVVENRQALETTKIYSEILDSTIDHFGLMMNHDLNRTMQLVATITLVFCVPTAVGGFFGMNVGVPLANDPWAFPAIIAGTFALMGVMLAVLKKFRWW